MIYLASNDEFTAFTSSNNYAAHVLIVHFYMIEYVFGAATLGAVMPKCSFRGRMTFLWLKQVVERLPREFKRYAKRPMELFDCFRAKDNPDVGCANMGPGRALSWVP